MQNQVELAAQTELVELLAGGLGDARERGVEPLSGASRRHVP